MSVLEKKISWPLRASGLKNIDRSASVFCAILEVSLWECSTIEKTLINEIKGEFKTQKIVTQFDE